MTAGYRYERRLGPDEALVHVVVPAGDRSRPAFAAMAQTYALRFGFSLAMLAALPDPKAPQADGAVIRHLAVVFDRSLSELDVAAVRQLLDRPYHSVGVCLAYPDERAAAACAQAIQELKLATSDRLNFIRPDQRAADGGLRVSDHRILESLVAETVRIKYFPRRLRPDVPERVLRSVSPFFEAASALYGEWLMYHRGTSDGCFAVRCADGLAITATKTCKIPVDPSRIVVVHDYDEESNSLSYSGRHLPSADSVELFELSRCRPALNAFLHSHASMLITRNPEFRPPLRIPIRPYGEAHVGRELAEVLGHQRDGLVVLDGHGELFTSERADDSFFTWIREVCIGAQRSVGPRSAAVDGQPVTAEATISPAAAPQSGLAYRATVSGS